MLKWILTIWHLWVFSLLFFFETLRLHFGTHYTIIYCTCSWTFPLLQKSSPPSPLLLMANLRLTLVCASSAASRWFSQDLPAKRCEGQTKCFLLFGSMQCVLFWLWSAWLGGETSAQIYSCCLSTVGFFCFLLSFPSCQSTGGESRAKDPRKERWRFTWDRKHID